jgi:hypothetical protein
VWVVHTYEEPGTYDVHVTAAGTVNTISDGSGEDIACETDFTNTFVIGAAGNGAAPSGSGETPVASPEPGSGDAGADGEGGSLSPVLWALGAVAVIGAGLGGGWMMIRQRGASDAGSGPPPIPQPGVNSRFVLGPGTHWIDEDRGGAAILIRAVFGDATSVEVEDEG